MFREEIKKIPMDRKALRNFGLLMACVLLLRRRLALVEIGGDLALGAWRSGALAAIGLAVPAALKPFYKGWMILAVMMGWVMTRVVLTLVYYFVLTPIGFLGRVFGEQFLQLKLKRSGETTSYWIRRSGPPREKSDYERQF